MKAELQKVGTKSDISSLPKVAPVAPCEDKCAEDGAEAAVPAPESRVCPKPESEEPSAKAENGLSSEPSSMAAAQEPDDTSARQAEPVPRTEEVRASVLQMDSSVFLDDDSNQPMPVSRFFGNVELMQVSVASRPPTAPGTKLQLPALLCTHDTQHSGEHKFVMLMQEKNELWCIHRLTRWEAAQLERLRRLGPWLEPPQCVLKFLTQG